jgi:hypothetical protein
VLDMTDTIAPKSDQMNSDDLMSGPRTFTITGVKMTGAEDQPVAIYLAEFPSDRPFKPSKSMRRVMVAGWTKDASTYTGKRLTLYRDPDVRFGGQDVGGIRISQMSGIDKPLKLALTVSKGKRSMYVVQPLPDAPPPSDPMATAADLKALGEGMNRLGITDRAAMLATVSQVIDREIESSKELTRVEAAAVLDWIKHEENADTEPTLPGAES